MNAYVQNLYQLVWSTKYRKAVLHRQDRPTLFAYIRGILKNKRCVCFALGGVEDHLHIVTHIHQSIAVANLVKDIKLATHQFIEQNNICTGFEAWQRGYGAFTYHASAKDLLIRYVEGQEAHHAAQAPYRTKLVQLLEEHAIEYDADYLD